MDNTDSLSVIGLFVVVIWNGKGKYLRIKLLLAGSFNSNIFKNLKYVERNGILIIDADIPRFIKRRRLYYIEFFVVLARLVNCVNYYKELIGYNRETVYIKS